MLIGSQAFQETPKCHAPAIMLALIPNLASWATGQINGALSAAGMAVGGLNHDQLETLVGKMKNEGVLYHGLQILGGGAILGGLILGAIAVCIIDRNFKKASGFALAGAILTFFGFMHGERIGLGQTPVVAASYVAVSIILFSCGKYTVLAPKPVESAAEPAGESLPA
jgi:AGZA family xanthine/uracil permease-like MFS transporter